MAQDEYIFICPECFSEYDEDIGVCPHDGAKLRRLQISREDPMLGRVLDDRWVIEAKIGEGGMGSVYRAQQLSVDRKVAIKTLNRSSSKSDEYLGRFLREANLATRVSHPNLVSIYDFGQTDDGVLYIVMELLQGQPLHDRIKERRPMTLSTGVAIGAQICAALAAAHDAGIVHRDLKPENIFLIDVPGGDVFIKVLDFGIAKSLSANDSMTKTGQVFGTPEYMSPEQCRGDSDLDGRSDLYALGCILYEMLTGATPFQTDSMLQVLFRHVSHPVPAMYPSSELAKDPSYEPLKRVVYTLLQKDRSARYQAALEVREALERALDHAVHPRLNVPAWFRIPEADEVVAPSGPAPTLDAPGFAGQTRLARDPSRGAIPSAPSSTPRLGDAAKDTRDDPPATLELALKAGDPVLEPVSPKRLVLPLALATLATVGAVAAAAFVLPNRAADPPPSALARPTEDIERAPPKIAQEPPEDRSAGAALEAADEELMKSLNSARLEATARAEAQPKPKPTRPPRAEREGGDEAAAILTSRAPRDVKRVLQGSIVPQARRCFAVETRRDDSLVLGDGAVMKMTYRYDVSSAGEVLRVSLLRDKTTVYSANLDACVKDVFTKATFSRVDAIFAKPKESYLATIRFTMR